MSVLGGQPVDETPDHIFKGRFKGLFTFFCIHVCLAVWHEGLIGEGINYKKITNHMSWY